MNPKNKTNPYDETNPQHTARSADRKNLSPEACRCVYHGIPPSLAAGSMTKPDDKACRGYLVRQFAAMGSTQAEG